MDCADRLRFALANSDMLPVACLGGDCRGWKVGCWLLLCTDTLSCLTGIALGRMPPSRCGWELCCHRCDSTPLVVECTCENHPQGRQHLGICGVAQPCMHCMLGMCGRTPRTACWAYVGRLRPLRAEHVWERLVSKGKRCTYVPCRSRRRFVRACTRSQGT